MSALLPAADGAVVCVGQAVLDRIYVLDTLPVAPGKTRARELLEVGGGIAANAAVAVARLGGAVALWSRVGDDLAGHAIVQGLAAEGVDVSQLRRFSNARSSTSAVLVDALGERLIVNDPGLGLDPDAAWLALSGLSANRIMCVLADARWPEGALAAFAAARAAGIPTVLDAEMGSTRLPELVALADYAIFAEQALAEFACAGQTLDTTDPARVWQALARVRAAGARHAGVTLGARGYHWLGLDAQTGVQPAFPVGVVDTTGAGDAFHGAFAWALAQGCGEAQSARMAAAVAALNCTRPGGRAGLPTRDQLEQFLAQAEPGRPITSPNPPPF